MSCESRGFHRIPAMDLECLECGKVLTPAETLANEREMIRQMRLCRLCLVDGPMHATMIPDRCVESRRIGAPMDTWICSMFPLCHGCWLKLTPGERLPYYRAHWLASNPGPQHLDEWFTIEAAVLGEGQNYRILLNMRDLLAREGKR